jgi:autoinducer 2-degrading protein
MTSQSSKLNQKQRYRLPAAKRRKQSLTMTRFGSLFTVVLLALVRAQAFAPQTGPSFNRKPSTRLNAENLFGVIVQASIEPDRMREFLDLIQTNAENSRKEPGCLRFDVLRSQESPNEFFFYELYKDVKSVNAHKATSHYALWADFKESGGVINSVSHKADVEFLT